MTPIVIAAAWTVTAYAHGCGATGLTKAATRPVAGHAIAADPAILPLGSLVLIDGWPGVRQVHDTGSLVRGRHLDVYVDSCREARQWGRQQRRVEVLHVPRSGRKGESR